MRAGVCLPQLGPIASADAIVKVAQRAEALGYGSVGVLDRVLYPVQPQKPCPQHPMGLSPRPSSASLTMWKS